MVMNGAPISVMSFPSPWVNIHVVVVGFLLVILFV